MLIAGEDDEMFMPRRLNVTKKTTEQRSCKSVAYVTNSKCIGDDTKAAARQSLNCIKNKKNKMLAKRLAACTYLSSIVSELYDA